MSKQIVPVTPFDAADYLDSEETIAAFLAAAAEDDTPGVFMHAVEAVAKARGMAQVAERLGSLARVFTRRSRRMRIRVSIRCAAYCARSEPMSQSCLAALA